MVRGVQYGDPDVQELKETVGGLTRDEGVLKDVVGKIQDDVERLLRQQSVGEQQNEEARGHHHEETSGSSGNHNTEVCKYRKLELPVFSGEDPLGWFFQVERYFHINSIPDTEKLEATIICLEGKALNWYQWVKPRVAIRNWGEFKREVLRRFHLSQLGDEFEMLYSAKQEHSVLEFVEEFERLLAPLRNIPDEALVGAFRVALKPEIRAELRLTAATTLREVMETAIRVEERNLVLEQARATRTQKPAFGFTSDPAQPTYTQVSQINETAKSMPFSFTHPESTRRLEPLPGESRSSHNASTMSTARRGMMTRRLSDAELARRRELGLCFKCGDKFSPNHVCRNC